MYLPPPTLRAIPLEQWEIRRVRGLRVRYNVCSWRVLDFAWNVTCGRQVGAMPVTFLPEFRARCDGEARVSCKIKCVEQVGAGFAVEAEPPVSILARALHRRLLIWSTPLLTLCVTGSYLRLIDSCVTPLKAQGPSRTCNGSQEEEE